MKRILTGMLVAMLLLLGTGAAYTQANPAIAENLKIVLIRHGEKPNTGDNLSCQGLNRAMELPKVLHTKFGVPDFTFVPSVKTGKSTSRARMFQTVTPFASQYNLTVNSKFAEEDYKGLTAHLLTKSGTILLVWEHNAIKAIAAELGIKEHLKWPDSDFDSIWIITFPKGTATLTKDKEGLNPSSDCKN